jgi:hypothetical protein
MAGAWLYHGITGRCGCAINGATMDAFPNQFVTLPEGGNGNTLDGPGGETLVARTAIANARALYPGRLIVQRNALSTCIPEPPDDPNSVWNVIWISRPDVAAQMLFQCFEEPTFRVNCGIPDPAQALMNAVDRGSNTRRTISRSIRPMRRTSRLQSPTHTTYPTLRQMQALVRPQHNCGSLGRSARDKKGRTARR